MSYDSIFEKCFFNSTDKCFRSKKHEAFSFGSDKFEDEVRSNLLNFDNLKSKDCNARITQVGGGYQVKLSRPHLAFSMKDLLSESNPGIDLKFSEDLLDYEPDEDLIIKTKIPLWVIKPMAGGNTVSIQRVW